MGECERYCCRSLFDGCLYRSGCVFFAKVEEFRVCHLVVASCFVVGKYDCYLVVGIVESLAAQAGISR